MDDIRRETALEPRILRNEVETLWVHLLRIPSLIRKSMNVLRSEYWYDAGYPELAVLWTAATQLLATSDSAILKLLPLSSQFLALSKDADLDERAIRDVADDPRNEGQNAGMLYRAFRSVADTDLDFDHGSRLIKRLANAVRCVHDGCVLRAA